MKSYELTELSNLAYLVITLIFSIIVATAIRDFFTLDGIVGASTTAAIFLMCFLISMILYYKLLMDV